MKKHIPNLLTLGNLFCGTIATIFAVEGDFTAAALFVVIGIFFDFLDGFSQRCFLLAMGNNIDYGDTYKPMQSCYVARINRLILAFSGEDSEFSVKVSIWKANPNVAPVKLLASIEERLSDILINAGLDLHYPVYDFNQKRRVAALEDVDSFALKVLAARSSQEFDKMRRIIHKISLSGFKNPKLTLPSLVSVVTLQLWDKNLDKQFKDCQKLRLEMMLQHKVPQRGITGFIKTSQKTQRTMQRSLSNLNAHGSNTESLIAS